MKNTILYYTLGLCLVSVTLSGSDQGDRITIDDGYAVEIDYCPSTDGMSGTCVEECSSHEDCTDPQICCSNGCGHTCQDPRNSVTCENTDCEDDEECELRAVICITEPCDNAPTCLDEDLECSLPSMSSSDCNNEDDMCEGDWDCGETEKCCHNGCYMACSQAGVWEDTGCPMVEDGQSGACASECSDDDECAMNEKCCSNGCGHSCQISGYPDPCVSNPCLNGGECESDGDSYTCDCEEEYEGKHCQFGAANDLKSGAIILISMVMSVWMVFMK